MQQSNISQIQIIPTIKNISYSKPGAVFNNLKNSFKLETYLKSKNEAQAYAKETSDTLGITIYTDDIKEVTLGDYTSYTMRISKPNTTAQAKNHSQDNTFYNLTIEDRSGVSNMYVTQYEPTDNWINNTNTIYEGDVSSMSLESFIEAGDDFGGETNDSDGYGGGSSSYGSSDGSPYYPTDCNGWVTVTIEEVPYHCSSDDKHWSVNDCNCGQTPTSTCTPPGYNQIPYYYCEPFYDDTNSGNSDTTNPNNTNIGGGGSTGSGIGNVNASGDSSIRVVLPPGEECETPPEGDINGDCQLERYEVCMKDLDYFSFARLNTSDKENIISFINANGCGETQQQFISLAIEALLDDNEVDFEDRIILDESFVNNPRLKCIYDKFKAGDNKISKYLENFLGEKPVAHLEFKADDNFKANNESKYWSAGAITSEPINYVINITFNTDSSLGASADNFPTIILAVELIHEMVHAEIYRKLLSYAQQPNIPWTRTFIHSLKNDYKGLSDYYTRFWLNLPSNSPPTSAQHQAMATHYRNMVKDAIKDFDNNQHTDAVYNALSWLGLKNTIAFNDPSIDQTAINNIIANITANDTKNCSN